MKQKRTIFTQALLAFMAIVFAVAMIYIKCTQSTEVMWHGEYERRNLTFEDMAKTFWEGCEKDER